MTPLEVAKICHATNKAYCESIGDLSIKSWDETPENIRTSVIEGVMKILDGMVTSPRESHESWLRYKLDEGGWTYGPIKNLEKKVHPCLVEYDLLPNKQKIKDELFFNIVTSLKPFVNR